MKNKKVKCGKITEKDYITTIKKISRDVYGFKPTKIFKNKKKYNRKSFKKIILDE